MVFDAGFIGHVPVDAKRPDFEIETPVEGSANADAMVAWTLVAGPRRGDVISLRLEAPDGTIMADRNMVQSADQAQVTAGRHRPLDGQLRSTGMG
jgi:hypothetical protein